MAGSPFARKSEANKLQTAYRSAHCTSTVNALKPTLLHCWTRFYGTIDIILKKKGSAKRPGLMTIGTGKTFELLESKINSWWTRAHKKQAM